MSWFSRLSRPWDALWFSPASPYPIAAFRILLGAYLLVYLGMLAPHVNVLFSSQGVYAPYLVPDYAPSPALAWLMFGAFYALTILLTLGYRSGLVIPTLIVVYLYHYFLSLGVKHSSFERLIVIYLLALWPARADAVWSCSARHTSSATAQAPSYVFASRLVRFQTIILYLGAGLWKAMNPAWRNGVLLHATLQGLWATPLGFWLVRQVPDPHAWSLISWSVIAGEILLSALLFIPRTRPIGIALGILFHLSNSVILVIPEFLVCVVPYVFFLREDTVERWGRTLWQKLRPRSRAAA